jgi:multidrug resistance efflux pump
LLARLDDADYKQKVRIDEATVHVRESNLALTLAGTREQEVKASQQTMLDAQADLRRRSSTTIAPSAFSAKMKSPRRTATSRHTALKRAEATFKGRAAALQRSR